MTEKERAEHRKLSKLALTGRKMTRKQIERGLELMHKANAEAKRANG